MHPTPLPEIVNPSDDIKLTNNDSDTTNNFDSDAFSRLVEPLHYDEITDDEIDEADAELEALRLSPESANYLDSYNHGNEQAEREYRQSFKQSAIESFKILLDDQLDSSEIFVALYDRQRKAIRARTEARENADIGIHYGRYVPGHEIEAARTRGQHHGLISAILLAESCERTPVERTDEQFEIESAAELERIRQHVGPYAAWLQSVCRWADGDYSTVQFHSFYFESDRKMGDFPPELLNVPGFVGEFVKHCNMVAKREQPEMALATGLATLGTLCGRKVRDSYDTRANVFFVALAGSGSGKEGPRKVAKEILYLCGCEQAVSESFASHAGLVAAVRESPNHLAVVDEFGRYLATQNSKKADSHLSLLPTITMRLFSSSNSVFIPDRYSDSKRNATVAIQNPNLNVLGTTVKENFYNALRVENIGDGFLNRYLVFEVPVDLPTLRQQRTTPLPASLLETAKRWADSIPGNGTFNEALPEQFEVTEDGEVTDLFNKFSERCDDIARSNRSPICRGLWPRTLEKARKLALLYACSESFDSPRITVNAAVWAISFATFCTEYVERAAGDNISDSDHQRQAKHVLKIIRDAGPGGIMQSILYRRIDHAMDSYQLKKIIESITIAEHITVEKLSTSGRPAFRLTAI